MKSFLLSVAVLASAAVAQTSPACAANYIVDTCLSTEKSKLAQCATGDYVCQCQAWKDIITCYNNCPNDPRQHDAVGQREIFCGYASQFQSSTTQPAKATLSSTSVQTPASATGNTATQSNSATATSSGSQPRSSNSAADLALNAGGVLAAVAGVVAVVL